MGALTQAERDTLNAAAEIILRHTAPDASWMLGANYWHGERCLSSATYFTSGGKQHSCLTGNTLADQIEAGIAHQSEEDADADADGAKASRIARLREELAELTGEAA